MPDLWKYDQKPIYRLGSLGGLTFIGPNNFKWKGKKTTQSKFENN